MLPSKVTYERKFPVRTHFTIRAQDDSTDCSRALTLLHSGTGNPITVHHWRRYCNNYLPSAVEQLEAAVTDDWYELQTRSTQETASLRHCSWSRKIPTVLTLSHSGKNSSSFSSSSSSSTTTTTTTQQQHLFIHRNVTWNHVMNSQRTGHARLGESY